MTTRKAPERRLAMLNSLRSNSSLDDDVTDTPYGKVANSIITRINALLRDDDLAAVNEVRDELARTSLYLDDIITTYTGNKTEFNRDALPRWVLAYLADEDVKHFLNLTPADLAVQGTVMCVIIEAISDNGKLTWAFASNTSKRGFAYLKKEFVSLFAPGDRWILKHNGKGALEGTIDGGVKMRDEKQANEYSHTFSTVWRHYH